MACHALPVVGALPDMLTAGEMPPTQSVTSPATLLATLDIPNIGSFSWVGNDKLLTTSRRQYRRSEITLLGLTAEMKTEYVATPRDLARMSWSMQSGPASVSPDGRWIIGSDVRGPRGIDLVSGEAQSWPGDPRAGVWLADSLGWMEIAHLKAPGDADAQERQDRVERDLNARRMEVRLFESFGDEWTNVPALTTRISLPYEAAVVGALGRKELLVASQPCPANHDLVLSRLGLDRVGKLAAAAELKCPRGGEIAAMALSPDRKSVAYLTLRASAADRSTLRGEPGTVTEIWITPLNRTAPLLIYSRTDKGSPSDRSTPSPYGADPHPRSLQWRPDGKMLGYVVNDQVVLLRAPAH